MTAEYIYDVVDVVAAGAGECDVDDGPYEIAQSVLSALAKKGYGIVRLHVAPAPPRTFEDYSRTAPVVDRMGYLAPVAGLVLGDDGYWRCPKCGETSGNSWEQCEGKCPLPCSQNFRGHGG